MMITHDQLYHLNKAIDSLIQERERSSMLGRRRQLDIRIDALTDLYQTLNALSKVPALRSPLFEP